jgi:cellulose synthase (UDP-forming)
MSIAFNRAKKDFLKSRVNKKFLIPAVILTVVYFVLIAFSFKISNWTIFSLLIFGEAFHVFQVLMYISTVWKKPIIHIKDDLYTPQVDIFITVCGEPCEIVRETVRAAKAMNYPHSHIFILNDGFVAHRDNWQQVEELATQEGVGCITRRIDGGAKAGNINNALHQTNSELVVIFDADHVPHADFLTKTVPYFIDDKLGFVQSPQFYKNLNLNYVTKSAWEQQALFFGAICKGKDTVNSATMCGTNMVIRREILVEVGGMSIESIAEDFLTGLHIHQRGYKSIYIPEVLAEGLAPEDFLSYIKQQFRWARGALDVIFTYNLFGQKGLSINQKLQYLSSVSFYLSGIIVVINALIPVAYFFTGNVPFVSSTMVLATVFIPYIFITLYILQASSNYSFTFRALLFSMGGFTIHLKALWTAILKKKSTFVVTPKRQQEGNFINLVIPHLCYIGIVIIGIVVAFLREGLSASFITNCAWAFLNVGIFFPFIIAALPQKIRKPLTEKDSEFEIKTPHIFPETI